ncbi:MAG: hypothetical protein LUM44_22440 [Pyrinomonadaceae bacterium]|nr:hypothetical protein [Pyrinomonadaceae bacterium]
MLLKCVLNKVSKITDSDILIAISKHLHLSEVPLEIGKEYIPYGIIFREGLPWYYICEEETDYYPRPHFGGFFEIVDSSFFTCWRLNWEFGIHPASILPKEWSTNDLFYENLINGGQIEQAMFQRFKQDIDKEFQNMLRI